MSSWKGKKSRWKGFRGNLNANRFFRGKENWKCQHLSIFFSQFHSISLVVNHVKMQIWPGTDDFSLDEAWKFLRIWCLNLFTFKTFMIFFLLIPKLYSLVWLSKKLLNSNVMHNKVEVELLVRRLPSRNHHQEEKTRGSITTVMIVTFPITLNFSSTKIHWISYPGSKIKSWMANSTFWCGNFCSHEYTLGVSIWLSISRSGARRFASFLQFCLYFQHAAEK